MLEHDAQARMPPAERDKFAFDEIAFAVIRVDVGAGRDHYQPAGT
jgi:hypothetical protein